MVVNVAIFQKCLELQPREPQKFPCLKLGEDAGTIAFNHKSLQRLVTGVGMMCKIIGQLDSNLHKHQLSRVFQPNTPVSAERDKESRMPN